MKLITICLFILFGYTQVYAQKKLDQITTIEYSRTLDNLNSFKYYKFKNSLIKVFLYENGSGSANLAESDEISFSILILRFQYGEEEIPEKFIIKDLINPKINKVRENMIHIKEKRTSKKLSFSF